jgi:YqaJ-like recombinase protein
MIVQRTPEWYVVKQGKISASSCWRLMKGETTRRLYMAEKGAERIAHRLADHGTNGIHIERGITLEPEAIREYERITGNITTEGYWVEKGTWGCTPDAFVFDDGLLSVKCPLPHNVTRISLFPETCQSDPKFVEYYWQAMCEMAATGRQWCDLALYCQHMIDPEDQLYIRRIERDEKEIYRLREAIESFNEELARRLNAAGASWRLVTEDSLHGEPPLTVEREDPMRYLMG